MHMQSVITTYVSRQHGTMSSSWERNGSSRWYLGALRDLACGNASNRLHIGQYKFYNKRSEAASSMASTDTAKDTATATSTSYSNGISIIFYFIQTYGNQTWEQIAGNENGNENGNGNRLQLRSMTNALGVMRNITPHSTPFNCQALHEANMTTHFINRLRGRTCTRSRHTSTSLYWKL